MKSYKKYLSEARTFHDAEYDPNYKGDYRNEVEELETLLSKTGFNSQEMQRRDMLANKYGINGPQDYAKLPAIKQTELARIAALQQSLVKASADADTAHDATQDPRALRAQAAELIKQAEALEKAAPAATPAPTTESIELTRWLKIAGLR